MVSDWIDTKKQEVGILLFTLAPANATMGGMGNPLMLTAGSMMPPQQPPMMTGASFSPNPSMGGF